MQRQPSGFEQDAALHELPDPSGRPAFSHRSPSTTPPPQPLRAPAVAARQNQSQTQQQHQQQQQPPEQHQQRPHSYDHARGNELSRTLQHTTRDYRQAVALEDNGRVAHLYGKIMHELQELRDLYGPFAANHRNVAFNAADIGSALKAGGRVKEKLWLGLQKESVAIYNRVYGGARRREDNMHYANAMWNLGISLEARPETSSGGVALMHAGFEMHRRLHPRQSDERTASMMMSLGGALIDDGAQDRGMQLQRDAVRMLESLMREHHRQHRHGEEFDEEDSGIDREKLASVYHEYGTSLALFGLFDAALEFLHKALLIHKRKNEAAAAAARRGGGGGGDAVEKADEEHAALCLSAMGFALAGCGSRLQEAVDHYEQAVALLRKLARRQDSNSNSISNIHLADALCGLGNALVALGRRQDGFRLLEEGKRLAEKIFSATGGESSFFSALSQIHNSPNYANNTRRFLTSAAFYSTLSRSTLPSPSAAAGATSARQQHYASARASHVAEEEAAASAATRSAAGGGAAGGGVGGRGQ